MSTNPNEASFDPDAVSAVLLGAWSFVVAEGPISVGLLHFTDTGRAIQFVFDPQQPEKRIPMRLWYAVESPTHLCFRPKPDQGWLRDYRLHGATMAFGAAALQRPRLPIPCGLRKQI